MSNTTFRVYIGFLAGIVVALAVYTVMKPEEALKYPFPKKMSPEERAEANLESAMKQCLQAAKAPETQQKVAGSLKAYQKTSGLEISVKDYSHKVCECYVNKLRSNENLVKVFGGDKASQMPDDFDQQLQDYRTSCLDNPES